MVDTIRDLAALQALLADNTAGDISAQDARDFLVSVFNRGGSMDPNDSIDSNDTLWDGNDASGMTTVTVTGTDTLTEGNGMLSVRFSGTSSSDINCLLKSHTFSTGDTFSVPIRLFSREDNFTMAGIIMTDGTASTSNAIALLTYYQDSSSDLIQEVRHGTLTNMGTAAAAISDWPDRGMHIPWKHHRLEYDASNSFVWAVSPDGLSYTNWGNSAVSKTMTPTHVGVCWSKWGGSDEAIATFGHLRKTA